MRRDLRSLARLRNEPWMVRGVALGGLVVLFRVLLGFAMLTWPTHSNPLRLALFVVLLAVAGWWGMADGRSDRRANPNPETGADLTMLWLKAAAVAGLGGGLAAWLLDQLPVVDVGSNSLLFELTSGASFILLVILLPALLGVFAGRMRAERNSNLA